MNQYQLYKVEDKRIREQWFKDHVPEFFVYGDGSFLKIKWRKPETWNYAVVYLIDKRMGHLCVFGDLGEAVYQWNPPIDIDFLGGLDLSYFDSKCQASSCGERGKTWNEEVAVTYIKEYIESHTLGEDHGDSLFESLYSDGYVESMLKTDAPDLALLYTEEGYKSWREMSRDEKDRFTVVAKSYLKKLVENNEWQKFSKHDYRRKLIETQIKFEELGPEAIEACESEFSWHSWLSEEGHNFFGNDYFEYGGIGRTISLRVQSHLIGLQMISAGLKSGKFSMEVTQCPWKRFKKWLKGFPQKVKSRARLSEKSR